ncbi:MAG: CHAT domain-containing protein, partial [Bacteroidota bacterium]
MRSLVLCTLLLLLAWIDWRCQSAVDSSPSSYSPLFVDYIHQPDVHKDFWESDVAKWERAYQQAADGYEALLEEEDKWSEAERLYVENQLAYCYLKQDKVERAAQYLNPSAAAHSQAGIRADHLWNKGWYLLKKNAMRQAIDCLNEADSLYEHIYGPSHLRRLEALTARGFAYRFYGSNENLATRLIGEALALVESEPSYQTHAAHTYYVQAQLIRLQRRHMQGLNNINLALSIAQKAPHFDTLFVADCLRTKGHMLKKMKETARAREALAEAIRLGELKGVVDDRLLSYYEGMMTTLLSKKDSARFYHYLGKLEKRFVTTENAFYDPRCLQAYYDYKTGNYERSLRLYEELERDYQELDMLNPGFYGEAYYVLSDIHRIVGNFEKAKKYVDLLIQLKFDRNHVPKEAPGQNWGAFDELDVSSKLILLIFYSKYPNVFLAEYESDPQRHRSQIFRAVEWYTAIDKLFFEHSEVMDENLLLTFAREHFHSTYSQALRACYLAEQESPGQAYLEQAHRLVERMKYSLLSRHILLKQLAPQDKGHQALLAEEQRINDRLADLRQRRLTKSQALDPKEEREMLALHDRQQALFLQLKEKYPSHFYVSMQQRIPPLAQIQQQLEAEGALALQYHIGPRYISTFVILPNDILFRQWERPPDLMRSIQTYQAALRDADAPYRPGKWRQLETVSRQLYQYFIEPLEAELAPYPKWIICPDASSALFPFGALLVPTDSVENAAPVYLMQERELSYVFSMKQYAYGQGRRAPLSAESRILAYAFSELGAGDTYATVRQRRDALQELPGSAAELLDIRDVYGEEAHRFRFGVESSKADFLAQLPLEYDILHLALHAASDDTSRYNNRLYFKGRSSADSSNILFGPEIEKLDLDIPLVVLSACETGRGEVWQAEGTFSLA